MRARAVFVFGLAGCNSLLDIHDFGATRDASGPIDVVGMIDAMDAMDAPPDGFDPDRCPTGYIGLVGLASRYRYVSQDNKAKDHFDDCAGDALGTTHLLVLSSAAERGALAELVPSGSFAYLGAIQRSGQATPIAGWIDLAGAPFDPSAWAINEPNDSSGTEIDLAQFARLAHSGGVSDTVGSDAYQAICECDGIPIASEVNDILAGMP